jgi:hypothetical protein
MADAISKITLFKVKISELEKLDWLHSMPDGRHLKVPQKEFLPGNYKIWFDWFWYGMSNVLDTVI